MGRTSISSGIDFAVAQFAKATWQVEFKSFADAMANKLANEIDVADRSGRWPDLLAWITVGQGNPEYPRQRAATGD
jgi:hypothetical protein